MKNLKDVIDALYKTDNLLVPCKDWQIRNIEEELNVRLPTVYKEFLLTMGKSAGNFMLGSSCFYDDLIDINMDAIDLLEENNFKPLPNNSFVFWMHQGYQFAFFSLDSGDDPPVYYYSEVDNNSSNNDFIPVEESFSMFLYNQLKDSGINVD